MHEIQQQLETFLDKHPVTGRFIVAFSGGCDSTVLLHTLNRLHIPANKILAVHVNHNLQDNSAYWEKFCCDTANQLGVDYHGIRLDLGTVKSNIEEQARILRYQAFSTLMTSDDVLMTAHHRDDQAETFLLQLLRGAGLRGLSAMNPVSGFPPGKLLRPLLNFSRQQIEEYAEQNSIQWIDDPSNTDNRFDRNFLRNEVLPLLETRWSAAKSTIARSAENCREAAVMIDAMSAHDLENCIGAYRHSLSINCLNTLSSARQHAVIRAWVEANDFPLPDRKATQTICTDFIDSRQDAKPVLKWSYVQMYRFGGFLYLIGNSLFDEVETLQATQYELKQGYVELPYPSGRLLLELSDSVTDDLLENIEISFREQGQTINIENRHGTRKLKKLFQEWNIPPWMRNFVPIIYVKGQCMAIADYAMCEVPFPVFKKIHWQPPVELDWRNNLIKN
jgi:tRNA(Ile)-lysidine synthase